MWEDSPSPIEMRVSVEARVRPWNTIGANFLAPISDLEVDFQFELLGRCSWQFLVFPRISLENHQCHGCVNFFSWHWFEELSMSWCCRCSVLAFLCRISNLLVRPVLIPGSALENYQCNGCVFPSSALLWRISNVMSPPALIPGIVLEN